MLKEVRISAEVYAICVTHAVSTEKHEVIGLLIGDIDAGVSNITASVVLQRSDKRCNRVEISPEQLSAASQHSEDLAKKLKRPMRVTGWYHSHPHITVWPSHVDVTTQKMYQMMDKDFVGLIFSFFNQDKNSCGPSENMVMTCFQADEDGERLDIPVVVVHSPTLSSPVLQTFLSLSRVLCDEENEAFHRADATDHLTSVLNQTAHTKALGNITEIVNIPIIEMLEQRLQCNKNTIKQLEEEKAALIEALHSTTQQSSN